MKITSNPKMVAMLSVLAACQPVDASDKIDFTRDIRPILSNACFHCHGPDKDSRQADLRLDQQQSLFGDGNGSPIVVAGNPDGSELVRRILSHDPDEQMPPPDSNKTITKQQRRQLIEWVKQGAEWKQHWAFEPLVLSPVPSSANKTSVRNEIDGFVLAALESAGLQPSAQADPHTLLRRVYLDLIGLPPTIEEADKWLTRIWGKDLKQALDEEEWLALVDELLHSPHYGERWARRWLDLARYADTNGYEKDRDRSIWPYRDWVVNAINGGMPFDRFTVEQLAGDMLPNPTEAQKIATGFHRNTMLNEEGGIDPLEFRYHAMTDRVATTGTTWLGLTLGCCQCHTHKYDPISHHEYFQVFAFLNNADEPYLNLSDSDNAAKYASNLQKADSLLKQLPSQWPTDETDLLTAFASWTAKQKTTAVDWQPLRPTAATSNLPILTIQDDCSIFASGDTAKRDDYVITLAPSDRPITAIRLEALPDERLPANGPGSTYYEGTIGDFYLTEIKATSAGKDFPFSSATHSYAKNRYGKNPVSAALTIDGDIQTGWSVHDRLGERHVAVYVLEKPIPAGVSVRIDMAFGRHFASSLGRFRFSAANTTTSPVAHEWADRVEQLLTASPEIWTPDERQLVMDTFLMSTPELAKPAAKIRQLRKQPRSTTSLVFSERPAGQERPTFRHHRGEYLQPKDRVEAALPDVLAHGDISPGNRLEFARWLVSDQNPLTARVVVNRHWATFFGTGLVKTVDDFGLQGEYPSHPQLLDWLAVTFSTTDDWSIRQLHRRIVCSDVYRQSSHINSNAVAIDPDNRLLSYSPRFRLDAEIIRDQLLVAANVLSEKIGGPPVKPPQPAGVTEAAYGKPKWNASLGDDRYRRSLYTYTKRTAPFAMFSTFDAPSGEACIARRNRSNSPLQALTMLNDVMLMDLSRQAGTQLAEDSRSTTDRMVRLFRQLLVRPPTSAELAALSSFQSQKLAEFQAAPQAAAKMLDVEFSSEASTQLATQAAWAAVARALFGLDETLTRE